MKKKILTISLSIILIICIIFSLVLINRKPDISHIETDLKVAEFTKPSVVRINDLAGVKWSVNIPDEYWQVEVFFEELDYMTYAGGSGSGAIISSNGYIVTNAHVVGMFNDEDSAYDTNLYNLCQKFADRFGVSFDTALEYLDMFIVDYNIVQLLQVELPNGEMYDGEIKSFGAPVGEGKDVAVIKIEANNLPILKLGNSNDVQLQDRIWVFGYPGAAESSSNDEESSLVVSITDGRVSATDKKSEQGSPVLQVSAASTHGNSGGPVMNKDGEIIGLLTFRGNTVNGQEVQGFNFAVPVSTVNEFIPSGAENSFTDVDILYRNGLSLYWAGYYKDALEKFEQVERLYPEHSEASRFIPDCQAKLSQSKTLWSNYKIPIILFDVLAAIAIILMMFFTFVSKRKKLPISEVTDGNNDAKDIDIPNTDANLSVGCDSKNIEPVQKDIDNSGTQVCIACGLSVDEHASFCSGCGQKLDKSKQV